MSNTRLVAVCALLAAGCSEFDLRNNSDGEGGPAPDILVTPPSLEFGLLSSGDQEIQSFNVQNVGDATLNVSDVVIGAGIAFTILGPETTFDLEPGESTDVEVRFEPMGADENFGQALVMSDDPDSPEAPVDLLGFGAVPELQITPGSHVFEAVVPCGETVQLELKNVGTEDLTVTDWNYESGGLLVLHDDVARPLLPITLAPGETGFVDVEFLATTAGADFGQLTVFSNDPRGEVTADQNGEGSHEETKTEVFTEPGVPPVDVMILIDHSGSMQDANTPDIEAGFPDFVNELQAVADWQLLEVTREDGCANGGIIDPSTPNPAQLLIDHAWDAGGGGGLLGGYLTEALLQLAAVALDQTDPGECNAGFLRPGALLHIIVISDEPEQSGQTAAHWVSEYESYVAAPEFVKVSGVVSDGSCPLLAEVGTGYLNAISLTGGSQVDICNSAWGSTFGAIASEVLAGSRSYNLEDEADPPSVVVTVNGTVTTDITVTGDSVTVNSPPVGEGDLVEITYGVLADCTP